MYNGGSARLAEIATERTAPRPRRLGRPSAAEEDRWFSAEQAGKRSGDTRAPRPGEGESYVMRAEEWRERLRLARYANRRRIRRPRPGPPLACWWRSEETDRRPSQILDSHRSRLNDVAIRPLTGAVIPRNCANVACSQFCESALKTAAPRGTYQGSSLRRDDAVKVESF